MIFEDNLIENLVFGRSRLNSRIFEKLFISYSCISFIKQCALRSFYIKMFVFQKATISRFSIDWTCCSIDRKCDKYFGYNMHGSIGARSIEPNFRLIEIRSEGFFKKAFSLTYSSLYSNFQKSFCFLSSTDPPQTNFCHFFPYFSQRFLSSSASMSFLPLLFHFIHIFHAF